MNLGRNIFKSEGAPPENLGKANHGWVSSMTRRKGVVFDILSGSESSSRVCVQLVQHHRPSGVEERRLKIALYRMTMELSGDPRKFLLRVDRVILQLEHVDRRVDPKDIEIGIPSGLSGQYDAEVRMLERSSDWPTQEWIEPTVIDQFGKDRAVPERPEHIVDANSRQPHAGRDIRRPHDNSTLGAGMHANREGYDVAT